MIGQVCVINFVLNGGWEKRGMEGWCMSALSFPQPRRIRMKRSNSPFKGKQNTTKDVFSETGVCLAKQNRIKQTNTNTKSKTKPETEQTKTQNKTKSFLTSAEISVYSSYSF